MGHFYYAVDTYVDINYYRSMTGVEVSPSSHLKPVGYRSGRIGFKANGKIQFIDTTDVIAVESMGSYVLIKSSSKSHMLRETLSTIAEELGTFGFVRIHRSVLVNGASVKEIQSLASGDYVLRMQGGSEFTVTRTYKKNLQILAQCWLGTSGFA